VNTALSKISKRKSVRRHKKLDAIEQEMAKMPQITCPIDNLFTPNLYTRICNIPKGTFLTSENHKTEHPFFIMSGRIQVANIETNEAVIYEAPFIGVTKPNTRRMLYALEDTVWATCHVTTETDIEKIGEQILEQRDTVVPQYKINNQFKITEQ